MLLRCRSEVMPKSLVFVASMDSNPVREYIREETEDTEVVTIQTAPYVLFCSRH